MMHNAATFTIGFYSYHFVKMCNITTNVDPFPNPINEWHPVTCNTFIQISNFHPAVYAVQLGDKLLRT